jgi:curved DNA-binding protein CbpA
MDSFLSLYDILNVPQSATSDEIKSSFRKLAKIYHPDKNNSPNSNNTFIIILNAYQTLSNIEKRREYDFYLNSIHIKIPKKDNRYSLTDSGMSAFSLKDILSHINYFLWDIEIFLNKDYKRCFNAVINGRTIKEYILHLLVFIDKWILFPAGLHDYFMESRKLDTISFAEYFSMFDAPLNTAIHRPFYSINNYFYDIRKRIDKFINKVRINDLSSYVDEDNNIRLIDCIIETQNYIIFTMNLIIRSLNDEDLSSVNYSFSNRIFESL